MLMYTVLHVPFVPSWYLLRRSLDSQSVFVTLPLPPWFLAFCFWEFFALLCAWVWDHSSCLDVDRFGTFRHLFKHLMRISRGIHPTFAHPSNLRTNECLCFLESVVLVTCDVKFSRHSIWRYQIRRFYAYIALAHCVP